jgi:hypothetical protein
VCQQYVVSLCHKQDGFRLFFFSTIPAGSIKEGEMSWGRSFQERGRSTPEKAQTIYVFERHNELSFFFLLLSTKLGRSSSSTGGSSSGSRRASKGTSRGGLLLLGQLLLGAVQDLEEGLNTDAHAGVQVRLGALEVIHEIVAENDGHIDGLGTGLLLEVAIEEHLGDETVGLSNVLDGGDFSRRGGLGEIDRGSSTDGLFELLCC